MRFSVSSAMGMEVCKRLEDAGHRCKSGVHEKWADAFVTLDGPPAQVPGVNCGLLAQAIQNDPTYLPMLVPGLPKEDSVLLLSEGSVVSAFRETVAHKLVPLGLGIEVPRAMVLLRYSPMEVMPTSSLATFRGVVRVTRGGKMVRLVDDPGTWAALMEVYPLQSLFTLPPRLLSPKQPLTGAWAISMVGPPEVPQPAIKHVLETSDLLYVSARGVTRKEVHRRVERAIERLDLDSPVYRKDLLKRR